MIRDSRQKLIYYPEGNHLQTFDLKEDPQEQRDISGDTTHAEILGQLTNLLIQNMYGSDLDWIENGELIGAPDPGPVPHPLYTRAFGNQRGLRFGHEGPASNMPSRM